jgi:sporulation protein YpjB
LSSYPYYELVRGGVRMKINKQKLSVINVLILTVIFVILQQNTGLADHHSEHKEEKHVEWQQLNKLAEESLNLTNKQEFAASRKLINDLASRFLTIETGKYLERIDQAHILLETILNAKEALNQVDPLKGQANQKVLKMRLALDAVSHKKQPLWINYYPVVAKDIDQLRFALEQDKRDLFYHTINSQLAHFEMVRPALIISHPQEIVEQLESQMKYINDHKSELWNNKDQTILMINQIDRQFKLAFFQEVENSMQPFLLIILGIGTLIGSVLSYVAWRKYKGETARKTVVWRKHQ